MRLMRNEGIGKYSVIDNRTGEQVNGAPGSPDEFFVIKLKDMAAPAALRAYADAVFDHDPEFAADVEEMAERAEVMPNRQWPD